MAMSGVGGPYGSPWLCTTYEGRDTAYLHAILPYVDVLELAPDVIAAWTPSGPRLDAPTMRDLQAVAEQTRFVAHGVGLSLGSYDGFSPTYLPLVADLQASLPLLWHSEHLAYTSVDGEHLGTMLALPKTHTVLEMICDRVKAIQDRIRLPFLLENVVHILPDYPGEYTDAAFLNQVTRRTGCGILLDIYNLECDAQNHGFDIEAFLDELDLSTVGELHLACGTELDGYLVDVHSRGVRDSTIALARSVVERASHVRAVTYEILHQAIPAMGHEGVIAQLQRIRVEVCTWI